jgi:hypothetical protein
MGRNELSFGLSDIATDGDTVICPIYVSYIRAI